MKTPVRTIVLANNRVGLEGLSILRDAGAGIEGLVVHAPKDGRRRDEIVAAAALPPDRVFDAPALRTPDGLERVRAIGAELAVSLFFGHILRQEFIDLFPKGVMNVHPALLPWNRGSYPNVWAIVDRTPAGATVHFIDAGVDTGDVIAQREVTVEPWDTGKTLYVRLEEACLSLLRGSFPAIARGEAPDRRPQPEGGTSHRARDVARIDEIVLDREYRARDLIDVLRARTFEPHPGAWFRTEDGAKVYLRLELIREEPPE